MWRQGTHRRRVLSPMVWTSRVTEADIQARCQPMEESQAVLTEQQKPGQRNEQVLLRHLQREHAPALALDTLHPGSQTMTEESCVLLGPLGDGSLLQLPRKPNVHRVWILILTKWHLLGLRNRHTLCENSNPKNSQRGMCVRVEGHWEHPL